MDGLISRSPKQRPQTATHPCGRREHDASQDGQLGQRDAAVAAGRLPGAAASVLSGRWGLPVRRSAAATSRFFQLRTVRRLLRRGHRILLEHGLAVHISGLAAGSFLLRCPRCDVGIGLSEREGAHLSDPLSAAIVSCSVEFNFELPRIELGYQNRHCRFSPATARRGWCSPISLTCWACGPHDRRRCRGR